jgi:hypothetical protein
MSLGDELEIARDSLCGLLQVSGADENAADEWRPPTLVPRALSFASCAAPPYPCLSCRPRLGAIRSDLAIASPS